MTPAIDATATPVRASVDIHPGRGHHALIIVSSLRNAPPASQTSLFSDDGALARYADSARGEVGKASGDWTWYALGYFLTAARSDLPHQIRAFRLSCVQSPSIPPGPAIRECASLRCRSRHEYQTVRRQPSL